VQDLDIGDTRIYQVDQGLETRSDAECGERSKVGEPAREHLQAVLTVPRSDSAHLATGEHSRVDVVHVSAGL